MQGVQLAQRIIDAGVQLAQRIIDAGVQLVQRIIDAGVQLIQYFSDPSIIATLVAAGVALGITCFVQAGFGREVRRRFDEIQPRFDEMLTGLRQNLTTERQTRDRLIEQFEDSRKHVVDQLQDLREWLKVNMPR